MFEIFSLGRPEIFCFRWEKCVKSVAGLAAPKLYDYEGSLTNAVGAMYAKRFFPLRAKELFIINHYINN